MIEQPRPRSGQSADLAVLLSLLVLTLLPPTALAQEVPNPPRTPVGEPVPIKPEPMPPSPTPGREAIIIVGDPDAKFKELYVTNPTNVLKQSYARLGFRVQVVAAPAEIDSIKGALDRVEARYRPGAAQTLTDMLVHYVGHAVEKKGDEQGWMALKPARAKGWSLSPRDLGRLIGNYFPDSSTEFKRTKFWAVFDANGMYASTTTYQAGIRQSRDDAPSGATITPTNRPGLFGVSWFIPWAAYSPVFAKNLLGVAAPKGDVATTLNAAFAATKEVRNVSRVQGQFVPFLTKVF